MNSDVEAYSSTGGAHSIAANRVSYYFDFKGPSISVDTACSSSLVALDMAVKSLEQGSCDVAITGGVNALISPSLYISFSKAGMLSPNGNISPLDKKANGYVRGEGVGILVLKRLDKAIEDHDQIHAVIKGTSVNHGGNVASLTVPNPKAQSELVLDACTKANVDVSTLNYIEMHGTGTPLGDPIEVNGLKRAFKKGQAVQRESYCGIASVKGNIGHLEAAAGVAGVIKTVLALKNKTLPGQCHFEELNPHIQLEGTPFFVVQDTQYWQNPTDKSGKILPRRAGVSSFGFGGANSHAVIEEYADAEVGTHASDLNKRVYDDKPYLIVLSAKTGERLKVLAGELVDYLGNQESEPVSLERIAYTLQVGRSAMKQRLGVRVKTHKELQQKLKAFVNGDKSIDGLYVGQVERNVDSLGALVDDDRPTLVNSWIG
ncbi:MAG: polyketide synthase, partial [Nitrososphaera sp.]|nr:polyketide synthase [Nitrososphaera sp.]